MKIGDRVWVCPACDEIIQPVPEGQDTFINWPRCPNTAVDTVGCHSFVEPQIRVIEAPGRTAEGSPAT